MSKKLDARDIVADHFGTLVDYRTGESSTLDVLVFFGVPAVGALAMLWCGMRLNQGQTTVLITALSIFAALLFNLLLLTHSIITDAEVGEDTTRRPRRLREIYSNISYSILVAVLAVALLLLNVLFEVVWVSVSTSGLVYFLVANFLLTLFLILKRIHLMLREEFAMD